jgi:hypothetical protein
MGCDCQERWHEGKEIGFRAGTKAVIWEREGAVGEVVVEKERLVLEVVRIGMGMG